MLRNDWHYISETPGTPSPVLCNIPIGPGGGVKTIVKGMQVGLRNPKLVKDLVLAMRNGTYEFKAARGVIAGYKDAKGVYYVSEGHHRMAAAQEILKTTGNAGPLNQLIQNGRWVEVTKAPVGARPLPSTSWWGAFRNWIGY